MDIRFDEDPERYLSLFRVVSSSPHLDDDVELRMLYSSMKHKVDEYRQKIDTDLESKKKEQAQIDQDILILKQTKERWTTKEQQNGKAD